MNTTKYELFYKNKKIAEFEDFQLAEAEARWQYFLKHSEPTENPYELPRNFLILTKNEKS